MGVLAEDTKTNNEVKSKKTSCWPRWSFTNDREVNAMLDLVKHETERIESRFLEPACGNGNFLAEVLRRKLAVVNSRYLKSRMEWQRRRHWLACERFSAGAHPFGVCDTVGTFIAIILPPLWGLGYHWNVYCYNLATPLGLWYRWNVYCYNLATPLGFVIPLERLLL